MKDFIQLPAIVKEVNEIYSENLEKLVRNSNVQKNKISLEYLRELYKTDRDFFMKIVDELSLRGFSFFTDK
ncbi:hypothetical protein V7Y60_26410, partial [Priestia megaterium]|uniref:hypothetical protein n=1 Tax=Priestia megaterium TaxID=1404 RepID=UPI003000D566